MSELEARKLRIIRKWIEIAEDDLSVAHVLLDQKILRINKQVAFHAQQSAEKYIKAWLCLNDVEIPYTHDIRKLRLLYEGQAGSEAIDLSSADFLTPYGVKFRYPEEDIEVTQEDAERAVQLASEVSRVMRSVLKRDIAERYAQITDVDVQKEYQQLDLFDRP